MRAEFFRSQPDGLAWPTKSWPRRELDPALDQLTINEVIGDLFGHGLNPAAGQGVSLALLVIANGHLVVEQYGTIPAGIFAPETPVDSDTPLISWSMAKSITHALTGIMVSDGLITVDDFAGCSQWADDRRSRITLRHLLQMRDGLDFIEDYVADSAGDSTSHVIDMLFGEGSDDVAGFAKSRPAKHEPGEVWSYSSGTTNILTSILGEAAGGPAEFERFMNKRLFSVLGMSSARPTFDSAGTFVGSSYVHATAQDFARFGYLYLRRGEWDGQRVISDEWVDDARRQHATDPDSGHGYGSHWWLWNSRPTTLAAFGYEGQRTIVDYERDLVVVHLGKWPAETRDTLDSTLSRLLEAFPLNA